MQTSTPVAAVRLSRTSGTSMRKCSTLSKRVQTGQHTSLRLLYGHGCIEGLQLHCLQCTMCSSVSWGMSRDLCTSNHFIQVILQVQQGVTVTRGHGSPGIQGQKAQLGAGSSNTHECAASAVPGSESPLRHVCCIVQGAVQGTQCLPLHGQQC